jgi:glycosyltransferase involved in cell wall biosynthesis
MKRNNPLVSVLMPVHNGTRFVKLAIESIMRQTYRNFELLAIDDGSTDNTWDILKKCKQKYPDHIRIYRKPEKTGAFAAVNLLFPTIKGAYIAPMDADDISHPRRLEKEVNFLESHPRVILVGSNANIIDARGMTTGAKIYPGDHRGIYKAFALVNPIIHPSCMIRRSLLPHREYLYHTQFGVNSDYYTLFNLLNYGKFANIPELLLSYRIHGANSSLENLRERFLTISRIRLQAVKKLNYRFPISAIPMFLVQYCVALVLPSSILLPLYLHARGMRKLRMNLPRKTIRFRLSLPAIIRYAFSFI